MRNDSCRFSIKMFFARFWCLKSYAMQLEWNRKEIPTFNFISYLISHIPHFPTYFINSICRLSFPSYHQDRNQKRKVLSPKKCEDDNE